MSGAGVREAQDVEFGPAGKVLQRAVYAGDVAGASFLVRRGTRVIERGSFGLADREASRDFDESTICRIASMTKPIVAVAILQLIERGDLRLDDAVGDVIPQYRETMVRETARDVRARRAITVRDLLSHSSGLGQGGGSAADVDCVYARSSTLAERVTRLATVPGDAQPGVVSEYSPLVGYDVLGRIIEVVAGSDLEEHLGDAVFRPLGMTDTAFTLTTDQEKRVSVLYEGRGSEAVTAGDSHDLVAKLAPERGLSGAAGLYSTLHDYDRFVQMLVGGGELHGARLLSRESVEAMTALGETASLQPGAGTSWGLGVSVVVDPRHTRSVGSWGWSGAFGTHFYIDPVTDLSLVLMTSQADIGGAASALSRQVEEALHEASPHLRTGDIR